MSKKLTIVFIGVLAVMLSGCGISAGTHGSLKGYRYIATKAVLDSAVMFVIKSNPDISRDTSSNYIIDVTNGKHDTIIDNYYNDGKTYLTIKIKTDKGQNEYTFRYYGDEESWKTSATAEIFICYAYDESGKGGSEGNGGVSSKQLKYLTGVFEAGLVKRIDKALNITHIETE